MANAVVNTITITFPDRQRKTAETIIEKLESTNLLSEIYDDPQDSRGWWEQHIGAKWARIQEMELSDDELYLNIESAWAEVEPLVNRLLDLFDDECEIRHEWVDEMPTWFGYRLYDHGNIAEDFERQMDEEELVQEYRDAHAGKDPDDDELWDWMWDWCYEQISE